MPDTYHDAILELKRAHNRMRWSKKQLFPAQLAYELARYPEQNSTDQDQFAVYKAFENNKWVFRNWVFRSLQRFDQNYYMKALNILSSVNLLTGDMEQSNFNAVIAHRDLLTPHDMQSVLEVLNKSSLLKGDAAQANFNAVIDHQLPVDLINGIMTLYFARLLTGEAAQDNFNAIVAHQNPHTIAIILEILNKAGLLTGDAAQANRDTVIAHQSLIQISLALSALNTASFLIGDSAQKNFNAIVGHPSPGKLVSVFTILSEVGLLTGDAAQINFNTVVEHPHSDEVARTLSQLNSKSLLEGDAAQVNFNAIVRHSFPSILNSTLNLLSNVGLLTGDAAQSNFNALVENPHPDEVRRALHKLNNVGLLTGDTAQINFNALVILHTGVLLHPDNNQHGISIWDLMPHNRPRAAELQAMITIAQNHADNPEAGRAALMDYFYTHIYLRNLQQPVLNPNQSTHTASVHASVSQSATNLLTRYRSNLLGRKLDNVVQEFASFVRAHMPNNHKQQAATRCIDRLTRGDYFYTDKVSQISTKQLMALAWTAIKDETVRIGTLNDAKQQLIEGLYEIQRGYNLSETGVDDNNPEDHPICTAGTFNKLCEKLAGLHPDVWVLYITKTGATAKLRIVAVEEIQTYLNTLVFGTEKYLAIQNLINNENMQPLWDIISPQVASRLFEEFGSLYPKGKTSPDFVNYITQGIYALTSETLVLPTASRNESSMATNPHLLFHHNENNDLDTVQLKAKINSNNRC